MYEVLFSKRAIKDRELLKSAGLSEKGPKWILFSQN